MAAVGELLLSGVYKILTNSEVRDFARQLLLGVDSELDKLQKTTMLVEALLSDAEDKQLEKGGHVKMWLDGLRDWAYDAEDILDEFAYEALRRKLMVENPCISNFTPCGIKFNACMWYQIKSITSKLEQLYIQREGLGLKIIHEGSTSSTATTQRPETTSLPTEPAVYGRDEDKAKILQMVFSTDEASNDNFRVIAIVGTGGIGKTTLAREVYNDKQVDDFNFDIKAWVCISDKFDVLRISKELLDSICPASSDPSSLNDVQVKLKEAVNGKRFLLVLDDVWEKNYRLWESLMTPFRFGPHGSKIIVTTRDEEVALKIRPIGQLHSLQFLSDADCWSLFQTHVEDRVAGAHQSLEFIREDVVKKCGGLPLAAKTLGGILRSKQIEAWENVLSSKIWDSPDASGILPVLRLSYQHLPLHLKRCFAHCAIFPKDYEFEEKELVLLWIAEGIIQQSENNTQLELAGQYFHHLLSVSLFQRSNRNSCKYMMHDLIHDLAESVFGEIGLRLEKDNKLSKNLERVRHFSYISDGCEGKNKFKDLQKLKSLRTFLPIFMSSYDYNHPYITAMVVFDLIPKLKKLRVLSLERYYITQIPDLIEGLIHLRYLNFSYTKIKSLPESISSLSNLQTLILKDCSCLEQLPSKIRYLTNLCCLDIKGENSLKEMPPGMKDLKNLQMLSNFIMGKDTSSNLEDLRNLNFLRGELHISKLDNMNDSNIKQPILSDKKYLEVLLLEWGFDNQRKEDSEKKVLDILKPHKNLKELTIKHYGGSKFSSWLGDSSLLSKLVVLKLENCEKCTILPSLGELSTLKNLTIIGMTRLKRLDSRNIPFKSLEILHFENLEEWEYWDTNSENEDVERFYHLHELSIVKCPKLVGKLPDQLPSLKILVIKECAEFVVSFSSLPVLCKVEIDGCKRLECIRHSMDFKSLNSMTLSKIAEFGNCLSLNLTSVEKPLQWIHNLASLKELSIYNCESLDFFSEIFSLPNLSSLEICECEALQSLPEELKQNKLKSLKIDNCNSLTFIARGTLPFSLLEDLSIDNCLSITCISSKGELPMTLKSLRLSDCPKMESIAETFDNCLCLREIFLFECNKLKSIPLGLHNLNCLKKIDIWKCSSLISLPVGGLPNTILSVSIGPCENLEGLVIDHLHSLDYLSLSSCPKIQTPLKLPNSVTMLRIFKTIVVESLPTNLTDLLIDGYEDVERLCQKDNVMPTSLTKLRIQNFPELEYLSSMGFQNLISLQSLEIDNCPKLKSIPDLGYLTSLEILLIENCPKLKFIPDLGNLTSLEILSIENWPELKSIPDLGSLTSLERLLIWKCPKLESFQSLPSSLLMLHIWDCPKLKRQCKRGKGKYWWKIKDIPKVYIDKFIYALEEEK